MLSRPEDPRCVKHAWEDRTLGEVAEDLARIQAGQDGRFVVSLTLADRDSVVDALNAQDMGSGSEPDPIFATIERHRAALAAYDDLTGQMERACDRNPEGWIADLAIPNLRDELADRLERHKNALTELLDKKPTTTDGCSAVLRYVHDLIGNGGGEIASEAAKDYFKYWTPPASFLANIAAALEDRTS